MTWITASTALLVLALAIGFTWYERTDPPARVVALLATLAALAVIGRIAFAPVPNVKPTTDIVLIAGFALGAAPGFVVGAVTAIASNLFFGQGPHTPWQMVAWGGVGVFGALLGRLTDRRLGRVPLALACGVAGYAYGTLMNTSLWVLYSGDHTAAQWAALQATGLPFDLAHVAGNVVFCLVFGPALVAALTRFRTRLEVTWIPPAHVAASVAASAALALAVSAPSVASAKVPAEALRYLERAQNADGGFGGAPGQTSTQLHTGWTALGLAAAGRNPLDVARGGRSVIDYTRAQAEQLTDVGEVERTLLVLGAAGLAPDAIGKDFERDLVRRRRSDGSFAGRVNSTAFAILALRSAGRAPGNRVVRNAGRWLARQANRDGGFNFGGKGGASGIDDTSAAVQGLVAAGRAGTPTVRRAVRYLVARQNRDGGYPLSPGGASNAQSTSFAVQALVAAGRNPDRVRRNGSRSPIAFLRSLIGSDGAVRYSRTSTQTPVWVTAQALLAFARKPFPIAAVPRARQAQAPAPKAAPAPAPVTRGATPAPEPAAKKARAKPKPKPKVEATATPAPAPPNVGMNPAAAASTARQAGVLLAYALAPVF